MKVSWQKFLGCAIALTIGFGISQSRLQAQSAAALGKFQLPFDATLGKKTLTSGAYQFAVTSGSLLGKVYIYQGQTAVEIILPQSFSGKVDRNANPVLVCLRHDGNVTIRALRLPNIGTFYFPIPKDLQTLSAQQPELIETVSVQVTGD
jgi:hypothetical protein